MLATGGVRDYFIQLNKLDDGRELQDFFYRGMCVVMDDVNHFDRAQGSSAGHRTA